jgi:hypothetical protein
MEQNKDSKDSLESKPQGRIKVRKTRMRWPGDVEDDVREMLVKRWRHRVNIEE